jgi:hypothetical protein
MNITYAENDIGIIEDVFPSHVCPQLVKKMDQWHSDEVLSSRQQTDRVPRSMKDDYSLCVHKSEADIKIGWFEDGENKTGFDAYLQNIWDAFYLYSDKAVYEDIKRIKMDIPVFKLQKTLPGGGYHVWHSERGERLEVGRFVVFLMYLNTLKPENAGETEFIRQELRVSPKENSIVFWPATYTHPHRGNPVYGNQAKYVLTGWLFI